jgi:hypothetical protein
MAFYRQYMDEQKLQKANDMRMVYDMALMVDISDSKKTEG